MSRIGKKPITVPGGVTVTLEEGNRITVKGPKGTLSRALPAAMIVKQEDGTVSVTRPSDDPEHRSLHGLTRSLIANMVDGVTAGFSKQLEISGVGYKAEVKPHGLTMSLGYSHTIDVKAPAGISLTTPNPTTVIVAGPDKELVGQIAAEIRSLRKPEPYKGKGVKYAGEVIRRKAGKAGGK